MCVMSCVTDLHAICLWHMASMVMRSRTLDEVKCPSCRSGLCRLGGRPAQYLLLPQCPPAGPMVGSEPAAGRSAELQLLLRHWWSRKGSAPLLIANMVAPAMFVYHDVDILRRFLRSVGPMLTLPGSDRLWAFRVRQKRWQLKRNAEKLAAVDHEISILECRRRQLLSDLPSDVGAPR